MGFDIQTLLDDIVESAVDAYSIYCRSSLIFETQECAGALPETFLQSHFLVKHAGRYRMALEFAIPTKEVDLVVSDADGPVGLDSVSAFVEYKRSNKFLSVQKDERELERALKLADRSGVWAICANLTRIPSLNDQQWHREELNRMNAKGYVVSHRIGVTADNTTDLCAFAFAKKV